ncbi:TolC family protein [Shewanella intestini]|uniref:TolC family protein n=1 Tax=Shewanella intestini TaxID=2017544 RepID=A0ABS5HZG0_9GAMM|nr:MULTISPECIES: TolC family protein [Shewanella]MBR9726809.1 TolC family protein [Shewanella intestini]MRG34625.1 hypothetical protein [Shewanella sp. XMDDZSB0408]
MKAITLALTSLSIAVLAGCTSAPLAQQQAQTTAVFTKQVSQDAMLQGLTEQSELAWWQQLDSPQLNTLVNQTLSGNQDLKAAAARLQAAIARLSAQNKTLWPQGDVQANGIRGNTSSTSNPNGQVQASTSAGGRLSWQPDLSGRLSALSAAAQAGANDQQGQYQTMVNALVSATVHGYLQWQNLHLREQITQSRLKNLEDSMAILQVQIKEGMATELAFDRTQAQYFEFKQQLPLIAIKRAQVEQTLAVLLNKQANQLNLTALTMTQYNALSLHVAVKSPQIAVMQRGDVQSAMQQLTQQSQIANSAARALYPDISLSAFAGIISAPGLNFDHSQSNWQITPTISWSLFSYPQLLAQLDNQTALTEASYHHYKQVLTEVLSTTELSLRTLERTKQQLDYANKRVNAAENALIQAQDSYQEGQQSYFELLNAQQDVLIAEQSQMIIHDQWLNAGVNVYSELSGKWASELLR